MTRVQRRPADGFGTNTTNPTWGTTDSPLLRLTYSDLGPNGEMSGEDRPNAREISNIVARQTTDTENAAGASDYLWIWGQFIDHDLSLSEADHVTFENIPVPTGDPFFDPFFTGTAEITFSRVASENGEYLNEITSYLDASMIYGSDQATIDSMRVENGMLLMTEDAQLALEGANLITGDVRAAENVALSSMHTIFTREHNRMVEDLAAENPGWSGDRLFDEARARIEAMVQAITYNEFLPILIGKDAIAAYSGYDPTVNVGISVEFSTAVFRFGHTLLSSNLQLVGETGGSDTLALRDAFFRPSLLSQEGFIDDLLRGSATQTAQALDTMIVDDVRSFLFGPPGSGGLDLASLNIERGRDLGLPSYNDMRESLGLARAESFADITSDAVTAARLEEAYGSVDLIDAWIGGLAEDAVGGGLLGEMFSLVMIDQFTRLRDGDPFWSESREGLSDAEREHLWDTRLSDIIERNTGVQDIQENVFMAMNRITGDDGLDWKNGTAGADFMLGYGDRDFLFGHGGDDEIRSGRDDDRLYGGNGDDTLKGGDGDDLLSGDLGNDILVGGLGADVFVFTATDDSTDVIRDFDVAADKLQIDALSSAKSGTLDKVGNDLHLAFDTGFSLIFEDFDAVSPYGFDLDRFLVAGQQGTAPNLKVSGPPPSEFVLQAEDLIDSGFGTEVLTVGGQTETYATLVQNAGTGQDGRLSYVSNIDGAYDLKIIALDETDGVSTLYVAVNGETIRTIRLDDPNGDMYLSPENIVELDGGRLDLSVGDEVSITGSYDGGEWTRIDELVFTQSTETPPDPNARIVVEAEDIIASGFGSEDLTIGGETGTFATLVQMAGTGQHSGELSYTVQADGIYDLSLIALDETDGIGTIDVALNGTVITRFSLDDPNGDMYVSPENLVELDAGRLSLSAGDEISVTGTYDGGEWVRIDKLVFTPPPAPLQVVGTDGRDRFDAGAVDKIIDGGEGWDTVTFAGRSSEVSAEVVDGHLVVTAGDGSVTTLIDVEVMLFEDNDASASPWVSMYESGDFIL